MPATKRHLFLFFCWAGCLLFLGMAAEYSMISRARAKEMARDIARRVRERHEHPRPPNYWRRAHGSAFLHVCKPHDSRFATSCIATTRFAAVSLLTLDDEDMYTQGAIKLARSLRWWFPAEQLDLVLMITSGFGISERPDFDLRAQELQAAGWNRFCWVRVIEHPDPPVFSRFHDMRAYSRLNVWGLTEYDAVLALDLDTLVIRDPSPLFTRHLPAMLAANQTLGAARDRPASLSDSFNAGVLLVVPEPAALPALFTGVSSVPHDVQYAEQGYLNAVFRGGFYTLPSQYNANVVSKWYEPELWRKEKSIVHFTVAKPWHSFRHFSFHYHPFLCWMWDLDDMCQFWDMM